MRRWIVPIVLPLLGVGLIVAAVIFGGKLLRAQLKEHERFSLAFTDIDCSPPEGVERSQFLAEVRKQTNLPERIALLDTDLPARLIEAFARHPWVETVEEVQVSRDRQVRVSLHYRVAALAVPLAEGVRAVDGQGVLLPSTASTKGLPVWRGPASLPMGPPGAIWGDSPLEAAAQVAGALHPYQDSLHLAAVLTTGGDVTLTTQFGSRILWGRPSGNEKNGEAGASVKVERLLGHCRKYGDLDHPDGPCEHDMRPADKARIRSLRGGS
ncbi:MAG TPA: hypothetical protein VGG61_11770 [Gemmataceae bacterium]